VGVSFFEPGHPRKIHYYSVARSARDRRMHHVFVFGIVVVFLLIHVTHSIDNACEQIDGDCPTCEHPLMEGANPVAEVRLSNESDLVKAAQSAEYYLETLSPSQIQRFDDPKTGLHTSLFYFCCHSVLDIVRMKEAFRSMRWKSFDIEYDDFGCNIDHDGKTIYLHALPSNQTDLFAWAGLVENAMRMRNVTVNHPRKSLFHMTLARVDPKYPVDIAVANLSHTYFGSHRLCSFVFEGESFVASDC